MSDFLSCRPSPLWLRVKKRALKTKEHSPEEIMQSLTQLSTLTYSSWCKDVDGIILCSCITNIAWNAGNNPFNFFVIYINTVALSAR